MTFDPQKRYILTGAELNKIWRAIDTRTLLKGPGYVVDTIPGQGTRLKIGDTGRPRQWQIRTRAVTGESPVAEIYGGTLAGLGLSGFFPDMADGEWFEVTHDRAYWIKLTLEVSGLAHTYYSSPETVETVYLPAILGDVEVELQTLTHATTPAGQSPTIDPETGASEDPGIYYFRIGATTVADGPVNDYIGPLGIGWCAPDSAHLWALT